MIIPTLGCPSRCRYCWSSEEGSPIMEQETLKAAVRWIEGLREDPVTITFHGGEPLLAGAAFFRTALPLLNQSLTKNRPSFAIQTNLWRMTDEIAEILAAYAIPIGSSIDGPEEITDSQRGDGYFARTMAGYEIAKHHGLDVRFICTFTNQSVREREKIVRFFMERGFPLKLHPALPSLRSDEPDFWALPPEEYGELLVYLLDAALAYPDDLEILNILDLCRCVFTRRGSVCTFADCMGNTFAIGPDGNIYPCYRFVGMDEWSMGSVHECPGTDEMARTSAWKRMEEFRNHVDESCSSCPHIKYCRGGCPYNALAGRSPGETGVDPHCTAYARIFTEISDRMNAELYDTPQVSAGPFGRRNQETKKNGVMNLVHRLVMK